MNFIDLFISVQGWIYVPGSVNARHYVVAMEEENQAKSSTKVKKSIVKTKPVSAQAKKVA